MTDIVLRQTRVIRDRERATVPAGRYVWRGPAGDPVFCLQNCRDFESSRVDVVCETPCEAVVICERTKNTPGTIPSTNNEFTRWRIFGSGIAARGFWCRATIDANNEHMTYHANTVYGCARPFVFEGQQSKHHSLTDNVIESFDVAVTSDTGFHWSGKTAAVGRLACEITRCGDPVKIQCVGFETVGRVLETNGPRTDAQSVVLDTVRFAADQLHTDGNMIVLRNAGPLLLIGGAYGDGVQPIPHISCEGSGEQSVTAIGTHFGSYGAAEAKPYPVRSNPGVRLAFADPGCTYATAASESDRTSTRRPSDPTD